LDELGIAEEDRLDSCDNAALRQVMDGVEEESAAWDDYQRKLKAWNRLHSARDVDDLEPEVLMLANSSGLLEENSKKPKSRYGHKPVLHCVLDDMMGCPLMSGGVRSPLVNFAIKHRHVGNGLGCSLYLCVQSWSAQGSVPRPIRENAMGVVVFNTPHQKQIETMAEELSDKRGADVFMDWYKQATEPDHGFLFVDMTSKDARYKAGWNTPLRSQESSYV
jgi:hypothetical protein